MKKLFLLFTVLSSFFLVACTNQTENIDSDCSTEKENQFSCWDSTNTSEQVDLKSLEANATNIPSKLWWLTPEDALEYMKNTESLVIIDTRDLETKPNWFIWWMEIPYNQILERFSEIPEWRPVLLHCGWGGVAPKAYQALLEANVHLPELSYIAWTPLFDEYNNWVKSD